MQQPARRGAGGDQHEEAESGHLREEDRHDAADLATSNWQKYEIMESSLNYFLNRVCLVSR